MGTLTFEHSHFDAVVACHGDLPSREVLEQFADVPLVAADGAAASLIAMDVFPEFVVGDLDSLDEKQLALLRTVSELVLEPDQDSNDFEKSLRFAASQQWRHLLVVGLHGGDLEHTLNNWSVLMKLAPSLHLTVLDRNRYIIPMFSSFAVELLPDELVSLIPQPSARLSTKGLRWQLVDEELTLGVREGARNVADSASVEIEIHSGSVLFCCDSRMPHRPEFRYIAPPITVAK